MEIRGHNKRFQNLLLLRFLFSSSLASALSFSSFSCFFAFSSLYTTPLFGTTIKFRPVEVFRKQ